MAVFSETDGSLAVSSGGKYQFPFNNGAFRVSGCCCVRFSPFRLHDLSVCPEREGTPQKQTHNIGPRPGVMLHAVCGF